MANVPENCTVLSDANGGEKRDGTTGTPAVTAVRRSSRTTAGKIKLPTEYNLRASSIINRLNCETRRGQPRQPKPKNKPPPLSKYRRKTANARERDRMREINDAFEELRQAIPTYRVESDELDPSGKITKITTLRLAMNYISALRDILGYGDEAHEGTTADSTRSDESSSSSSSGDVHTAMDYDNSRLVSPDGSTSGSTDEMTPGNLSGLDSEGESISSC